MNAGQLLERPLLVIALIVLALTGLGYGVYGITYARTGNRTRAVLVAAAGVAVGFMVAVFFSVEIVAVLAVLVGVYRVFNLVGRLASDQESERVTGELLAMSVLLLALVVALLYQDFLAVPS